MRFVFLQVSTKSDKMFLVSCLAKPSRVSLLSASVISRWTFWSVTWTTPLNVATFFFWKLTWTSFMLTVFQAEASFVSISTTPAIATEFAGERKEKLNSDDAVWRRASALTW